MYTEMISQLASPSSATTESLTSAAIVQRHLIMEGAKAARFMFHIATATVSSGNIVVKLKKYLSYNVSTNAVTIATLNIPTAIAAGQIYYVNCDSVDLLPGNELIVEVTTAAAGGGAAGAGFAGILLYHGADDPRNIPVMVLSA